MLVKEAIAFAEQELKRSNNLNSRLDSEILVSHLINIPRDNIKSINTSVSGLGISTERST